MALGWSKGTEKILNEFRVEDESEKKNDNINHKNKEIQKLWVYNSAWKSLQSWKKGQRFTFEDK